MKKKVMRRWKSVNMTVFGHTHELECKVSERYVRADAFGKVAGWVIYDLAAGNQVIERGSSDSLVEAKRAGKAALDRLAQEQLAQEAKAKEAMDHA